MNPFNDNAEMRDYFDSLPMSVQTNYIESGAKADTLDQLKAIADQIIRGEEK